MNCIPITGKPPKCSGISSGVFAAKYPVLFKDHDGVVLNNEEDILGRWSEYFKDRRDPITFTPSDRLDILFGRRYHHCSGHFPMAVKTLKAAGCDEIGRNAFSTL